MTALRQEAIDIIEKMPEENIRQAVVFLQTLNISQDRTSEKKEAFKRLENFRKNDAPLYFPKEFDYEKELEEAREKKYGSIN